MSLDILNRRAYHNAQRVSFEIRRKRRSLILKKAHYLFVVLLDCDFQGCFPILFFAFTSALALSSACTTSLWPFCAACIRAVVPSFTLAFDRGNNLRYSRNAKNDRAFTGNVQKH